MEQGRGEAMSTPLRILISVIGVGAMFALGRYVRSRFLEQRSPVLAGGRPLLRAVPPPVVPETEKAAEPEVPEVPKVAIHAQSASVYEHARKLEYFDELVRRLGLEMTVISEQPGEFFGVRIEHADELYGTVVVQLEELPGRNAGTEVTVHVKYKHAFDGAFSKATVEEGVKKEVQSYLEHLKEACEAVETAL